MTKVDDGPIRSSNDPFGPLWYRGLVMKDADAQATRAGAGSGNYQGHAAARSSRPCFRPMGPSAWSLPTRPIWPAY